VRFVTIALWMCVVPMAGLSAALLAAPVRSAAAAERVTYRAGVSISGQVTVSFHGDRAAGCEATFRCDVQGTMRWTPRSGGQLSLLGVPGRRLSGYLSLFGGSEATVDTLAVVQRTAADGTHVCADARGSSYFSSPLVAVRRRSLRFGLQARPGAFGPLTATPLGTNCGGPLPTDALQGLPTRTVSLRALRTAATRIDLSGSAPFAAGGLAGTVESSVLVRVRKARVRRAQRPRRATRPRPSDRPPFRNIAVEYRLARMTGSVPVEVAAEPPTCVALDACGLAGRLTVTPGPARGEAYVFAYARLPRIALRRALGLAPGPRPRKVAVYGYLTWTRARGAVSAALDRNGTPACRDTTPLSNGFIELRARGRRVTARFAGGGEGLGGADVLRTRCPGPLLADLGRGTRLAVGRIPRRALGRRTLTLHLDQGATALTPGYRLRSQPDLRIVLEREKVEEEQVPEPVFVGEDEGGGGGGGGGGQG
jgi:hypothetical protein